jgi:hypothetical protein
MACSFFLLFHVIILQCLCLRNNATAKVFVWMSWHLLSRIFFLLVKNRRREWLSRVRMRYKKLLESKKNIESDFYTNGSLNDDLHTQLCQSLFWPRVPKEPILVTCTYLCILPNRDENKNDNLRFFIIVFEFFWFLGLNKNGSGNRRNKNDNGKNNRKWKRK